MTTCVSPALADSPEADHTCSSGCGPFAPPSQYRHPGGDASNISGAGSQTGTIIPSRRTGSNRTWPPSTRPEGTPIEPPSHVHHRDLSPRGPVPTKTLATLRPNTNSARRGRPPCGRPPRGSPHPYTRAADCAKMNVHPGANGRSPTATLLYGRASRKGLSTQIRQRRRQGHKRHDTLRPCHP